MSAPAHSAAAPIAAWQYRRYAEIIEHLCRESAEAAGEVIAVDFAVLAQLVLATMDGLIIQYVVEPDAERARAGFRNEQA